MGRRAGLPCRVYDIIKGMKDKKKGNRYAVVDLEATGTGLNAKIIQIGIVLVEEGEIVGQYETDVNPYEPLDEHINQLTGITDEQLALAPDFGQVAGEVAALLEGRIFVAHNVKFDANLLIEALFLEGYDLHLPWVDTVELAQLCFPTLDKYGLPHLAQQLGLDLGQAHTAIADAHASAQLLLLIQEKLRQLPRQVVVQLLALAGNLLFESYMVLEEVYPQTVELLPSSLESVHGLVLRRPLSLGSPGRFAQAFAHNLALLGLEERAEQAQFASVVEKRLLDDKRVHFIQAGAGIGKTYGYLLPLLAKTREKMLVVVPTNILQAQLMEAEGAQLEAVFRESFCSLKSPKHYIKLDAFWKTLQEEGENRLVNQFKMHMLVWLCETETGDLAELKQRYRYPAYFDRIRHDGRVAEDSLFAGWDFWERLQRKAQHSRVLVTNHAYFLSHIQRQGDLLGNRIFVLDEAQKLLLTAEDYANQSLDLTRCLQLLQSKRDRARTLLERRLLEGALFEVTHLVNQFRETGKRELKQADLLALRQHVSELADSELQDLERLLSDYRQFWLEERWLDGKCICYLRASQTELLSLAGLLPPVKTFCISATLEISPQVSLANLLGFPDVTFDRISPPFSDNQLVVYPTDLPPLTDWSMEEHARFIAHELGELVPSGQAILVLFTSQALLLAVSDLLDEWEWPHLAQYKHGQEQLLKKRFEAGEVQLLLGSGLFWEGVDFSQKEEMLTLLTRLPFENPKDNFVKKMNSHLRQEGKNPFYDYHLPMMLLKLKQAIGRTNRREEQRSAVILLDHRIVKKDYGKQVLAFLDEGYSCQASQLTVLPQAVSSWFSEEQ